MKLTQIPACCAAYTLTHLNYFNTHNSWFQAELKKDSCIFDKSREHYGLSVTPADWDEDPVYEIRINGSEESFKVACERYISHYYNTEDFINYNFHLNEKPNMLKPGNIVVALTEKKFYNLLYPGYVETIYYDQTIPVMEEYVDALCTEIKDTCGAFVRDDFILMAITEDFGQKNAVVALGCLGFEAVKTEKSRNDTTLTTWYLNSRLLLRSDKVETWGAKRMNDFWQPPSDVAFREHNRDKLRSG